MGDTDTTKYKTPILGLLQTKSSDKSGRIIIYGDSNCIDSSHPEVPCFWMLNALLEYASMSHLPSVFKDKQDNWENVVDTEVPLRMEGNRLYRYSKVLEVNIGDPQARPLPQCPRLSWAQPVPLNISAPSNLYQSQRLLSLIVEPHGPIVTNDKSLRGKNKKHNPTTYWKMLF